MSPDVERWVRTLGLEPHPEGGWFREVFRSALYVPHAELPDRFTGERTLATSILYLLEEGERSYFHRLRSAEVWCHHAGGAMRLHVLEPGGPQTLYVGGDTPQVFVPSCTWFAAEPYPEPGARYSLVGCFVSPGFEYEDFELADRDRLLAEFPRQRELVTRFTREAAR
jgi:predicted cupin superfamily sugar epimerase